MNKLWILVVLLLLLMTACIPVGTEEHNFFIEDYEFCAHDCMVVYDAYNCTEYWYEWYEFNETGNCTCNVSKCLT